MNPQGLVVNKPRPVKEDQQLASYIAMVIRNAMEDFHCQHLTDDQMKELNPIIRNAICTALHAFNHYEKADAASRFVDYNFRMIPKYWEKPELLDGYVQMWDREGDALASGAD
jgi:hypothetical protein